MSDLEHVKCSVSPEDMAKIEELAKRMEVSPSRMASMLLRAGLQDNEVIIRIVTSDVGKRLKAGLTALGRKSAKRSER